MPFADAAAEELERAVALVEALVALARPAPPPVDLWTMARPLGVIYGALFAAQGGTLSLRAPEAVLPPVRVARDGNVVRLACEAAFDAVTRVPAAVQCTAALEEGAPALQLTGALATAIDRAVGEAAGKVGIRIRATADRLSVICPGTDRPSLDHES